MLRTVGERLRGLGWAAETMQAETSWLKGISGTSAECTGCHASLLIVPSTWIDENKHIFCDNCV